MRISRATAVSAALAILATHCSLLAPSDQALMGGDKQADGGSDASDASDAADSAQSTSSGGSSGSGSGGQCGQAGDCCDTSSDCCSGFACEQVAGVCIPCQPSGSSCYPQEDTCCSGVCADQTCK
jgi:hypothetical protein